jgi:hypothetical protein
VDVRCTRPCALCVRCGDWRCETLLAGLRAEVAEWEGRLRRHGERAPAGEVVYDCTCYEARRRRRRTVR